MTDAELNRAVAEARGWEVTSDGVWDGNVWLMDVPPLVCTSPAAWGALFEELAAKGYAPMLEYDGLGSFIALVGKHTAVERAVGRALALAFLKATQQ